MAMIRPPRCFSIGFKDAWHRVKVAVRFVASTASQSSRFIRSSSWSRVMPALLTTMSIRPCLATMPATAASTAAASVTSSGSNSARPPEAVDGIDGLFRVLAARGGNHHRALTGQRLGNRAADAA
jgi:hypothetical protein